ncbi:helix-turn-helix domain-containing protein [Microbulbifer agarilyticus]|uniref:DNA-3-methyladenine glycosylase 2 n=1 Tax=Microbulbifer agarilyticus TaxID=260552 RepID=UPI001C97C8A9|nr:DNA-3-methyladenine glycosylase 2 [Microbulbifer agarilyticus]MBY6191325.1 helix-turn-helix domain-containing protein [Microbulbifer agarilyticus]MBY6212764.1 helix-turn-helix domain-containing protein [Microbulbifer agarilyticus]
MQPDPVICNRARLARDKRFDGRFFTAVKTTGIFCRPICPARPPLEKNVEYFNTAAEATAAGYRPCLRCRPDAAPGSAAWGLVSTTVQRALALMRAEREAQSIEQLAERLGITSRYLRKLFAEHIGLSPLQVWQTERALFAFGLLRDTHLPVADVAFASGFNSLRRFNGVFKSIYHRTPSEVRRESTKRAKQPDSGNGVQIYLSYRPPFDWPALLAFFAARALPGVEQVITAEDPERGEYLRSFELNGQRGVLRVAHEPEKCRLRVSVFGNDGSGGCGAVLYPLREKLRRLFDLDADSEEIREHLQADPLLQKVLSATPGVRLPGAWDPFEYTLRAILGQQISVAAATTIAGRVARGYGEAFSGPDGEQLLFPSAEQLRHADFSDIGVTRTRAATLRSFVAATLAGEVDFDEPELEAFCKQMTALPGIGDWTAHYTAMRGLSMPDAFPASDLGILIALGDGEKKATPKQAQARAESWRPWRAYGALLLWQSLKLKTKESSST